MYGYRLFKWRKGVVYFVLVCFLQLTVAEYAVPAKALAGEPAYALANSDVRVSHSELPSIPIPPELGTIEETYHCKIQNPKRETCSQKQIIYIQDAHDSLEAQENIAKLIHFFVEGHGVKTVYEEGYEGRVPTDQFFGFIEDAEMRRKVSYFFLDKLRIGGAEFAHINRTADFQLLGADDVEMHLENIDWYKKNAGVAETTEKQLQTILREIENLISIRFPKGLKDWIQLKKRFERRELNILDYLKRMRQSFWGDEKEFRASYPEMATLLDAASGQGNHSFTPDSKLFFAEMERLEHDFAAHFLDDAEALKLFDYYQALNALIRLNRIEVTAPEFEALKEIIKKFKTEEAADWIFRNTRRSLVFSKRWEKNIQYAIRFYETAHARDDAVAQAMNDFLKESKEETAVLVFGGFHSANIKEILKGEGISYTVITPQITSLNEQHAQYYKQLMSYGHHPFEIPATRPMAGAAPTTGNAKIATRAEHLFERNPENTNLLILAAFGTALQNPGLDQKILNRTIENAIPQLLSDGERNLMRFASDAKQRNESRQKEKEPENLGVLSGTVPLSAVQRTIKDAEQTRRADLLERIQPWHYPYGVVRDTIGLILIRNHNILFHEDQNYQSVYFDRQSRRIYIAQGFYDHLQTQGPRRWQNTLNLMVKVMSEKEISATDIPGLVEQFKLRKAFEESHDYALHPRFMNLDGKSIAKFFAVMTPFVLYAVLYLSIESLLKRVVIPTGRFVTGFVESVLEKITGFSVRYAIWKYRRSARQKKLDKFLGPQPVDRLNMIKKIHEQPDEAGIALVINALGDRDEEVRLEAAVTAKGLYLYDALSVLRWMTKPNSHEKNSEVIRAARDARQQIEQYFRYRPLGRVSVETRNNQRSEARMPGKKKPLLRVSGTDRLLNPRIGENREESIRTLFDPKSRRRQIGVTRDSVMYARILLRHFGIIDPENPPPLLSLPALDEAVSTLLGRKVKILLKDETVNPTGSFKDRAPIQLYHQVSRGQSPSVAMAVSTGNHGAAVANAGRIVRERGVPTRVQVFVGQDALEHKKKRMRLLGAEVLDSWGEKPISSYREAEDIVQNLVKEPAMIQIRHADHFVVSGYATAAYEIADQLLAEKTILESHPEGKGIALISPLGSGGYYAGLLEILDELPQAKTFGVSAPPADLSFRSLKDHRVIREDINARITDGIAATPEPFALNLISQASDASLLVTEEDAFYATAMIEKYGQETGLKLEPTSGLPLAALLLHSDLFEEQDVFIMPLTSRNRSQEIDEAITTLLGSSRGIEKYFTERRSSFDYPNAGLFKGNVQNREIQIAVDRFEAQKGKLRRFFTIHPWQDISGELDEEIPVFIVKNEKYLYKRGEENIQLAYYDPDRKRIYIADSLAKELDKNPDAEYAFIGAFIDLIFSSRLGRINFREIYEVNDFYGNLTNALDYAANQPEQENKNTVAKRLRGIFSYLIWLSFAISVVIPLHLLRLGIEWLAGIDIAYWQWHFSNMEARQRLAHTIGPTWQGRVHALRLALRNPDERALRLMRYAFQDENHAIRLLAVQKAGELGDEKSLRMLRWMSLPQQEPYWFIRKAAEESIRQIEDKQRAEGRSEVRLSRQESQLLERAVENGPFDRAFLMFLLLHHRSQPEKVQSMFRALEAFGKLWYFLAREEVFGLEILHTLFREDPYALEEILRHLPDQYEANLPRTPAELPEALLWRMKTILDLNSYGREFTYRALDAYLRILTMNPEQRKRLFAYMDDEGLVAINNLLKDHDMHLRLDLSIISDVNSAETFLKLHALDPANILINNSGDVTSEILAERIPEFAGRAGLQRLTHRPLELSFEMPELPQDLDTGIALTFNPYKYIVPGRMSAAEKRRTRSRLGLTGKKVLVVAPEEDGREAEWIIQAYEKMKDPNLVLILTQDSPEFTAAKMRQKGLRVHVRKSRDEPLPDFEKGGIEILLLKSRGEVPFFLNLADGFFAGDRNAMEGLGVPVLFSNTGERWINETLKNIFMKSGAALESTREELPEKIPVLFRKSRALKRNADNVRFAFEKDIYPFFRYLDSLLIGSLILNKADRSEPRVNAEHAKKVLFEGGGNINDYQSTINKLIPRTLIEELAQKGYEMPSEIQYPDLPEEIGSMSLAYRAFPTPAEQSLSIFLRDESKGRFILALNLFDRYLPDGTSVLHIGAGHMDSFEAAQGQKFAWWFENNLKPFAETLNYKAVTIPFRGGLSVELLDQLGFKPLVGDGTEDKALWIYRFEPRSESRDIKRVLFQGEENADYENFVMRLVPEALQNENTVLKASSGKGILSITYLDESINRPVMTAFLHDQGSRLFLNTFSSDSFEAARSFNEGRRRRVNDRDQTFAWWFENYLVPFAAEAEFSSISTAQMGYQPDSLRALGFQREGPDQGINTAWVYDLGQPRSEGRADELRHAFFYGGEEAKKYSIEIREIIRMLFPELMLKEMVERNDYPERPRYALPPEVGGNRPSLDVPAVDTKFILKREPTKDGEQWVSLSVVTEKENRAVLNIPLLLWKDPGGKVILRLRTGELERFKTAYRFNDNREPDKQVFLRNVDFAWWFENNLLPVARRLGIDEIQIIQRSVSPITLRGLGFVPAGRSQPLTYREAIGIKDKTQWIYAVDRAEMRSRKEATKIRAGLFDQKTVSDEFAPYIRMLFPPELLDHFARQGFRLDPALGFDGTQAKRPATHDDLDLYAAGTGGRLDVEIREKKSGGAKVEILLFDHGDTLFVSNGNMPRFPEAHDMNVSEGLTFAWWFLRNLIPFARSLGYEFVEIRAINDTIYETFELLQMTPEDPAKKKKSSIWRLDLDKIKEDELFQKLHRSETRNAVTELFEVLRARALHENGLMTLEQYIDTKDRLLRSVLHRIEANKESVGIQFLQLVLNKTFKHVFAALYEGSEDLSASEEMRKIFDEIEPERRKRAVLGFAASYHRESQLHLHFRAPKGMEFRGARGARYVEILDKERNVPIMFIPYETAGWMPFQREIARAQEIFSEMDQEFLSIPGDILDFDGRYYGLGLIWREGRQFLLAVDLFNEEKPVYEIPVQLNRMKYGNWKIHVQYGDLVGTLPLSEIPEAPEARSEHRVSPEEETIPVFAAEAVELLDHPKVPAMVYVDYQDLMSRFSESQRAEVFAMAFQNPEKVRVVIYNADKLDERLRPFWDLQKTEHNVWITSTPRSQLAYHETERDFVKGWEHFARIHLSKGGKDVREQFDLSTRSQINFFRYEQVQKESGLLTGALLWKEYREDDPRRSEIMVPDGNGYYIPVPAFLDSVIRGYQADLVVRMAA